MQPNPELLHAVMGLTPSDLTPEKLAELRAEDERKARERKAKSDANREKNLGYAMAFLEIKEKLPEAYATMIRFLGEQKAKTNIPPEDYVRAHETGGVRMDDAYLAMQAGAALAITDIIQLIEKSEGEVRKEAERKEKERAAAGS